MKKIKLNENIINKQDINALCKWLKTIPQLTMGSLTEEFEKAFSKWMGVKYSVFVNSGSSANLAMVSLIKSKNKKIVVPAVSWATSVAPIIQLGFEPILCDCNSYNITVNISELERIFDKYQPGSFMLVHPLGYTADMESLMSLCKTYNVRLLEDTCESLGSTYSHKKLGTYGLMSSFSFYYGHHISTIEGGMVCTNNENMYNRLKIIRSHGWDRNCSEYYKKYLRAEYDIDKFNALYTFYHAGYNIRNTEIGAFLGLRQLQKLSKIVDIRYKNYLLYAKYLNDDVSPGDIVSSFGYPIITERRTKLVYEFQKNGIECRPLICGSMSKQPFYQPYLKDDNLSNAEKVYSQGLYVPNHMELKESDIKRICDIINGVIK